MKTHSIRIVGGQYRQTPIPVIDAPGLRPTPNRVRETLFNWLRHLWDGQFHDKQVLDLFAGSGALGFEAASQGAAYVQMVEQHPQAVAALRRLRNKLDAHQVRIHAGDALTALARMPPGRFDLILLDPPFNQNGSQNCGQDWLAQLWPQFWPQIWPFIPALLRPDGLVYIESESALMPPEHLALVRQGRAGQVHFGLLRCKKSTIIPCSSLYPPY